MQQTASADENFQIFFLVVLLKRDKRMLKRGEKKAINNILALLVVSIFFTLFHDHNSLHAGYFSSFCCRLLTIFQKNISGTLSVSNIFGSRSGPMFAK